MRRTPVDANSFSLIPRITAKSAQFKLCAVWLPGKRFSKKLYEIESTQNREENEPINDFLRPFVWGWWPVEIKMSKIL